MKDKRRLRERRQTLHRKLDRWWIDTEMKVDISHEYREVEAANTLLWSWLLVRVLSW